MSVARWKHIAASITLLVAAVAGTSLLDAGQRPGGAEATSGNRSDEIWLERLKTWSDAVVHHAPGHVDAGVITVAAWTAADLKSVVADFLALRRDLAAGDKRPGDGGLSREVEYKKHRLTVGELRAIDVFRTAEGEDQNWALKRGALLHADVALLAPMDWSKSTGPPDTMTVLDGVVVGYESHSSHWLVGRQLLDAVAPAPAADPFVQAWYHATSAALLEAGNLAAAKFHLEHAVDLLPGDADVQFEMGYYHLASAAPAIQAVITLQERARTNRARSAGSGSWRSDFDVHLRAAERHFKAATKVDPTHAEARLRLGYALLELDRVEDAAVQLRQADVGMRDPTLSYLSAMLLGLAEELLGHTDLALERYTKAASIVPQARSPWFAKAALERRRGRKDAAWQMVVAATGPTGADQIEADPWWSFYRWQLKPAQQLLGDLRALVGTESAR